MSRTLQFKRYPAAVVANTTGANGELIIDTTNYSLTIHDGTTLGGHIVTASSTDTTARTTANSGASYANAAFAQANAAFSVANTDLSKIETPATFDRQPWIERIAMCHWNYEELSNGAAWRHMKKFV
jgi:hypothetical protein